MSEISQESKSSALLMWVLSIFFGIIPSLIFFFVKKDDAFVMECTKEALNIQLNLIIAFVAGMIISVLLGFIPGLGAIIALLIMLVLMVVAVAALVFIIMGAVNANKGIAFKAPFLVRLIK